MKKGLVLIWFLVMFIIGTDTFVISPLLPTLQKEFVVSNDRIGWLVSAYALGYAVFALIAGPFSDRLNRKSVLIGGLLLFSGSTILCGFSSDFWYMIVFRLAAGIGAAIASPQIWASIATLSPPEKLVKYMGIATMGLGVSQAIGVPIGSFLAAGNWSLPFYVIGVFSTLLTVLVVFVMPNVPPINKQLVNPFVTYRQLFTLPHTKSSFAGYFIFQMGGFAAFTFLGKWLFDAYGLGQAQLGTVMFFLGAGNVVGSLAANKLIHKWGKANIFSLGMVMVMVIYGTMFFLPSVILVKGYLFINFFSAGIVLPITISFLQSLSPKDRGTIASLTNSTMYFATMVGAFIGGGIYAVTNSFFFVSLFTVLCFFAALIILRPKLAGKASSSFQKRASLKV